MPGRSDAEMATVVHREARRSEPTTSASVRLAQAARPTRFSAHAGLENGGVGNSARRSPRVGGSGAHYSHGLGSTKLTARPTTRPAGALNDITNVAAGRVQVPGKFEKQPASGQASVPAPERQLHPPAPAACSRPLTARNQNEAFSSSHAPPAVAPASVGSGLQAVPIEAEYADVTQMMQKLSLQSDADDMQNVQEYAPEIYAQFFRDENAFLPRPNYMETQADINSKMRSILLDWLVEVHMKYRMRTETLFLTINLIDRYLSRAQVLRKRLQLVGIVAMCIASKFEEINPPEVADFVHITDNAYSKEDVLSTECTMLTALNFHIVIPTAAHFFERLQKVNRCDEVHRELAQYILELGMLDTRMLRYPPSHIVSASLLLSNELLGKRPLWPPLMAQHSCHSEQALRGCAEELRELRDVAPKSQLQAVRKKFSMPQHRNVANLAL